MSSQMDVVVSNPKTIPSTDTISKLIRSAFAIYDFGLLLTVRSLSIAGFICKCYWNVLVSIVIISFLFITSVYRMLFIVTMRTKSVMKSPSNFFGTTRNRRLPRLWRQRATSTGSNITALAGIGMQVSAKGDPKFRIANQLDGIAWCWDSWIAWNRMRIMYLIPTIPTRIIKLKVKTDKVLSIAFWEPRQLSCNILERALSF